MLSKTISTSRSASFLVSSAALATSSTRSALVINSPRSPKSFESVNRRTKFASNKSQQDKDGCGLGYQKLLATARVNPLFPQQLTTAERSGLPRPGSAHHGTESAIPRWALRLLFRLLCRP